MILHQPKTSETGASKFEIGESFFLITTDWIENVQKSTCRGATKTI